MAPPPNSGDAKNKNDDDPLGGMDPMAWLESLAARQGANRDELTTAADLDIPLPPEGTVIDEPGYTPGYDVGKSASVKAETPKPVPQAQSQPPKVEPVKAVPAPPAPQPAAAADDPFGGMDPMTWLESLAARQGANPDELTTAANLDIPLPPEGTVIDEPGYTPGYDVGKSASVTAEPPKPQPVKAVPIKAEPPRSAAPEPQPVASTDDPLNGMDPMAWLESLAARQGANPEELTTSADYDIPLPPEGTVIDEPGYTPGYDVGKSASAKAEPPKAAPIKIEPVKTPTPPPQPEPQPVASTDDPLGGMDPMEWLESLAARQGASRDELTTPADYDIPLPPEGTVIDEPGYVDYDPFGSGSSPRAEPVAKAPQPTAPQQPEPVAMGDDPLGGMDPLAWLESLTADNGVGVGQFTNNSQSDSDQELDYTSLMDDQSDLRTPAPMSVEEAAQLLGVDVSGQATNDDPLGGMDPLAWLESLAARQGANPEELITGGNMELPPEPEADQSMSGYSAFEATMDSATAGMASESALSWLDELAREQTQPMAPISTPADRTTESPIDQGGASDDIDQVKEWLERAAQNLEETRDLDFDPNTAFDELPPAEAADLPDWLKGSLSQTPSMAGSTSPISDDISLPPSPEDLPDWLTQPDTGSSLDLANQFLSSLNEVSQQPEPVQQAPATRYEPVDEDIPSSSELEEMTRAASPADVDPWAEALDWEYERRQAGDETVPDWYQEAVSRVEDMEDEPASSVAVEPAHAAPVQPPQPSFANDFAKAESDMPDWLLESSGDQPAEAVPGEIPDWMQSIAPGLSVDPLPAIPQATTDDWLRDTSSAEPGELPDWMTASTGEETLNIPPAAVAPTPAKAPEPQIVAPAPVPAPVPTPAPRVEVQRMDEPVQPPAKPQPATVVVQPRVEPKPQPVQPQVQTQRPAAQVARPVAASYGGDHGETLRRAREHMANSRVDESLAHYQQLIDNAGMLEETRGDLRQIADQNPSDPRVYRMLGDTHMRLGDLQEALNTYRKALDQL